MAMETCFGDQSNKGVSINGGRYVQYNVYGNLFEVSSKYVPPLRPIGRGASGIVWCVSIISDFLIFHTEMMKYYLVDLELIS